MSVQIQSYEFCDLPESFVSENYGVILLKGSGVFSVDGINYAYQNCSVLFFSPYQKVNLAPDHKEPVHLLGFHADDYCIEYHKEEVACNGLLFNNIYLSPGIELAAGQYDYILGIFSHIRQEFTENHAFSESIIKTYIQLILALSSKQKNTDLQSGISPGRLPNRNAVLFQKLLELNFRTEKELSFYSGQLNITNNTLSKVIRKEFGKSPSQLINERTILEGKKLLHLTYRSVKEIAAELGFGDEFYFSRYFKKATGCSPKIYREKVGVSIVAKMSM